MTKYLSLLVMLLSSAITLAVSDRTTSANIPGHTNCQRKCQAAAKRFYRECRQNGGTERECKDHAREALHRCVEENCTPTPPCDVRCQNEAVQIYRSCMESGEEPDDCAMRARHALVECLTKNCAVPDSCEKRCEYLGHHFARLCVAEGGSQDVCAARAREFVQQCVREHCPPCGGVMGISCPKSEFCMFRPGECEVADKQGQCIPIPDACPLIYEPVCGCDGETYGNACEAAAAQVSIDHVGPCADTCGGILGEACPEGQFCQFRPERCNVSDDQGTCRSIPDACPDVWMPVCGCDGKTHGNACEAAMNLVSIDYQGECTD